MFAVTFDGADEDRGAGFHVGRQYRLATYCVEKLEILTWPISCQMRT